MISATYSRNSVTITMSDAKEEKSAFALLEKLKAWHELDAASKAPAIARIATPNGASLSGGVSDGPNLAKWEAATGKRFRFPSFGVELGWNAGDREACAGMMLALLEKGEIVRTVSGWQLATGGSTSEPTEDDGSDVI